MEKRGGIQEEEFEKVGKIFLQISTVRKNGLSGNIISHPILFFMIDFRII